TTGRDLCNRRNPLAARGLRHTASTTPRKGRTHAVAVLTKHPRNSTQGHPIGTCATSGGLPSKPRPAWTSGGSPSGSALALRCRRNSRHRVGITGSLGGKRCPAVLTICRRNPLAALTLTAQSYEHKASRHALCFPKRRPRPSRP